MDYQGIKIHIQKRTFFHPTKIISTRFNSNLIPQNIRSSFLVEFYLLVWLKGERDEMKEHHVAIAKKNYAFSPPEKFNMTKEK